MKRTISSLLVLLVLLNTMGYYFIFWGLEVEHDARMSSALNEDFYDSSSAITIRIPLALPYQYDNPNFVRAEGKFMHEGESYRLIKQKYERDTLTVVCLRDDQDKQIRHALADFVGTFTDSPAAGDVPSTKSVIPFTKEYLLCTTDMGSSALGWTQVLCGSALSQTVNEVYALPIAQPPEA